MNDVSNHSNQKVTRRRPDDYGLFALITVGVAVVTGALKCYSLGWMTLILIAVPILPLQLILFVVSGLRFAEVLDKDEAGYELFMLSCVTSLLYVIFFEDGNDVRSLSIFPYADSAIALLLLLVNLILSIRLLRYCKRKRKT